MHVKTKKISFLGLLLALSILLQYLGSYLEMSTLSFLIASSLCIGIAIYETNLTIGGGFFIASIALSFLLSPNKFYWLTYCCLCIYVYLIELMRQKTIMGKKNLSVIFWIVKLVFFNGAFLFPALLFFRDLLFATQISWNAGIYAIVVLCANITLIIFDKFYEKLIPGYWERLKRRLRLDI